MEVAVLGRAIRDETEEEQLTKLATPELVAFSEVQLLEEIMEPEEEEQEWSWLQKASMNSWSLTSHDVYPQFASSNAWHVGSTREATIDDNYSLHSSITILIVDNILRVGKRDSNREEEEDERGVLHLEESVGMKKEKMTF